MKQRVALYARVSSERQAEEQTIESQLEALRHHVKEQGLRVDETLVFADNGVSGTTLIRPALETLRDQVGNHEIDRIVVLCPDRLARKQAHQYILAEEFTRCGVTLEFLNHPISSSAEDQLFFQMQGAIAEYEREKIMERSRRGKLFKARNQKVGVLSCAPYGYEYVARSDSRDASYHVRLEQAKVVRRVFELYTQASQSLNTIARTLTHEQVPAPQGGSCWHASVLYRMVKNPAYMGQAAYKKTQVVPRKSAPKAAKPKGHKGLYPRSTSTRINLSEQEWISIAVPNIVSPSVFEQAQQLMEEKKRLAARNNTRHEYLLSSLLRCQECGHSLHAMTNTVGEKQRSYYQCAGAQGYRFPEGKRCSSHHIRCEILDDLVWTQTKRLIEQPEIVLEEYSNRVKSSGKKEATLDALLKKKKKELHHFLLEKSRLLDLYQAGTITMSDIQTRLSDIEKRISATTDEHSLLEADQQQQHQQLYLIEQFCEFQKKLKHNIDSLDFENRKKVVRLLVKEILVDCRTAKITVNHIVPLGENVYRLNSDRVIRSASNPQPGRKSFVGFAELLGILRKPSLGLE